MDTDLDTLATALYVKTDDLLKAHPEQRPPRPPIGLRPQITDAELITLAVMQALLGFTSEARWLRYAHATLTPWFPYLPAQPGYNKRLRRLGATMDWLIAMLGTHSGLHYDDVWVVDSTPVECARSRETVQRSDLAGWAEYGYCASHSRYFWGLRLRLHLICTVHGLPVGYALTGAKADEQQTCLDILAGTPTIAARPIDEQSYTLIGDKNYFGAEFETTLRQAGCKLLRPTRKGEKPRPGAQFFKPLRQVIESINNTLKGQLDLEHHGGRTPAGVVVRIVQRLLAMTTAIWYNNQTEQPVRRSLVAFDH